MSSLKLGIFHMLKTISFSVTIFPFFGGGAFFYSSIGLFLTGFQDPSLYERRELFVSGKFFPNVITGFFFTYNFFSFT